MTVIAFQNVQIYQSRPLYDHITLYVSTYLLLYVGFETAHFE